MKELICIVCPRGCHLTVDDNLNVSGNNCPRGEAYAKAELTHPTRTLTSTVKITSKLEVRCPVKTDKPLPKEKIYEAMDLINHVKISAPVKIGDIILENILGTDVNIVATKNINE